jgi:hypothetical protein
MYSHKLVCAVKVGNKILRENNIGQEKDAAIVHLPFGSEFSLILKNLSYKKALVKVSIDGRNVTEGGLIIDKNSEIELERSVGWDNSKSNDPSEAIRWALKKGRKFKFIKKTEEISEFRGDRADDGIIRISYQFEHWNQNLYPKPWTVSWVDHTNYGPIFYRGTHAPVDFTPTITCGASTSSSGSAVGAVNSCYSAQIGKSNAEGITVEGSVSRQEFQYGSIGRLEDEEYVMIFKLSGFDKTDATLIAEPVTVEIKKQCPSCGKKYKGKYEFCPKDGTALK